ncbi:MAG: hypothetical protein PHG25_03565 [Candidatus Pacebacteria bacterium]|nr:hypothetical protein [Candidatus Paceibacterota bacterium]
MKYQKYYNTNLCRVKYNQGILLVDIVLALALATIFIVVIAQSSVSARSIFYRTKEKAVLLTQFQNMLDTATSTLISTSSMVVVSKKLGNERREEDVLNLSLVRVSGDTISGTQNFTGIPMCSFDFVNHSVVGSFAWSDKKKPAIHVSVISLPINPTLLLTDFQIRNGIAYISVNSSVVSDPDLLVINFKDRARIQLVSSINTGSGISALTLANNRVYAAIAGTASQLHVIRFDVLATPVIEKKFTLPLPLASTSPTKGSAVFYFNNKVFLGTEKWDGDEFSVIDVSQPASPKKVGGLEIGSKVNDILVQNNVAYVADSDDKQLRVLNIINSTQPILQSVFMPSGGARQDGKTISVFEDNINFGRTSGGFDISVDHEFFALSTSSLTQNNVNSYASINIPGGLYGMVQDRHYLYLATRETGKEFKVLDREVLGVSSTPIILTYPIPVTPQKITCDSDHLYVLSALAPVIYDIYFN